MSTRFANNNNLKTLTQSRKGKKAQGFFGSTLIGLSKKNFATWHLGVFALKVDY
jgi:hypothetical protein